jgi:hypothetical protein
MHLQICIDGNYVLTEGGAQKQQQAEEGKQEQEQDEGEDGDTEDSKNHSYLSYLPVVLDDASTRRHHRL